MAGLVLFSRSVFVLFSSEILDGYYGDSSDIAVKSVSLNATLANSAQIKMYVYLIRGYGDITNGDETFNMRPGKCRTSILEYILSLRME